MMPGIRLMQCPVCESTREIETGIKVTYCCGQKMEETEGQEMEPQSKTGQEEMEDQPMRWDSPRGPGIRLMQCPSCGGTRKVETGIKVTYCCGQKMEEARESEEQADEPQEVPIRIIDP